MKTKNSPPSARNHRSATHTFAGSRATGGLLQAERRYLAARAEADRAAKKARELATVAEHAMMDWVEARCEAASARLDWEFLTGADSNQKASR
jgi:hypothetical protein